MTWLLAWLWQGMALVLTVGLLLRLVRPLNAAIRHLVWWITLTAVLALPLVLTADALRVPSELPSPLGSAATSAPVAIPLVIPRVPDWAVSIAIGGWLGFVVMRLGYVARSFGSLQRLKRTCTPMPAERERRLSGWMAARDESRRVTIMLSDEVALPSALGLGRPLVALPIDLVAELTDADLDRVVLHEWAHLRRRDDWWRLGQALIEAILGLHPAVWWIGRMIDVEREAACDDVVVSRLGETQRYVSCLALVAERSHETLLKRSPSGDLLAQGVTSAGRQLRYRVSRLLDRRQSRRPWPFAAALSVSAAFVTTAVGAVTPLAAVVVLVEAVPERPLVEMALGSRDLAPRAWSAPSVEPRSVRPPRPASRVAPSGVAQLVAHAEGRSVTTETGTLALVTSEVTLPASPEVTLASAPIVLGDEGQIPLPSSTSRAAVPDASAHSLWLRFGDAGSAVGTGAKAAGLATAGFFGRVGTSLARAF